mgnify:FL=1
MGEREGIRKKPAPDSVNEVLKTLGCSRDRAVYIGDSDVDIQTAANAQMDHIIVEWGFRDIPFLISKVLVEKPEEILEIVEGR